MKYQFYDNCALLYRTNVDCVCDQSYSIYIYSDGLVSSQIMFLSFCTYNFISSSPGFCMLYNTFPVFQLCSALCALQ